MAKPIETRYAGRLFRSRLEARWAVLFDLLRVKWEYEVEGYSCERRLSGGTTHEISYLPDFWLPELGCWAEVKGAWANEDAARDWLHCVADLSSNYLCPGEPGFSGFFLLGAIDTAPALMHMHEGSLSASPNHFDLAHRAPEQGVAHDTDEWPGLGVVLDVPSGGPLWPHRMRGPAVDGALSARFEHGRSGPC